MQQSHCEHGRFECGMMVQLEKTMTSRVVDMGRGKAKAISQNYKLLAHTQAPNTKVYQRALLAECLLVALTSELPF